MTTVLTSGASSSGLVLGQGARHMIYGIQGRVIALSSHLHEDDKVVLDLPGVNPETGLPYPPFTFYQSDMVPVPPDEVQV